MMVLCGAVTCTAQEINLWRGGEIKADWNDPYKWKLLHVPSGDEAVHFRQANSVIAGYIVFFGAILFSCGLRNPASRIPNCGEMVSLLGM